MQTQWLVCPLPHSKNEVWQIGAKGWRRWFYLNPKVKHWREAQQRRWEEDGVEKYGPGLEVELHAHLPEGSEYWDVDHGISNMLDTMTGIIYEDDSHIERVVATVTRDAPQHEAYVDIFIYDSGTLC